VSWKSAAGACALVSVTMLTLALTSPAQALQIQPHARSTSHEVAQTLPLPPLQEQIDAIASTALPSSYAGDVLEADGIVLVYVTADQVATLTGDLTSALGSDESADYEILPVAHSFAAMEGLTMEIAHDESSWATQGISITSVGPDVESNLVSVTISPFSATNTALLQNAYGSNWVEIDPATGTLPVRDYTIDRFADVEPYYGGDAIWFDNEPDGTLCTDGFGIENDDEFSSFTAGHCNGETVDTNIDSPREMGAIWFYEFVNDGLDFEAFYCDCTGDVWANSQNTHPVIGSVFAGVGDLVAMDGAASGEVPGNDVQQADYCQKFSDGITTCHLTRTYQAGAVACQEGDSGGPVYQRISGTSDIYAAGEIVGSNNAGQTCYYGVLKYLLEAASATLLTE